MRRLAAVALIAALTAVPLSAQKRRRPARTPPPPPPKIMTVVPDVKCPLRLGIGVSTKRVFCDVLTERDPANGIIVTIPAHRGVATLTFDLHNRHTYSEEAIRAKRAFARYTATVGVLTMDNTLLSRAVVENEFRTAADLVDRVGGGAGPGGVKAVAPTGTEAVSISIPEAITEVSILGEKLSVRKIDGNEVYVSPGRPVALVSNVMVQYTPAPPAKPKPKKKARGRSRSSYDDQRPAVCDELPVAFTLDPDPRIPQRAGGRSGTG